MNDQLQAEMLKKLQIENRGNQASQYMAYAIIFFGCGPVVLLFVAIVIGILRGGH